MLLEDLDERSSRVGGLVPRGRQSVTLAEQRRVEWQEKATTTLPRRSKSCRNSEDDALDD